MSIFTSRSIPARIIKGALGIGLFLGLWEIAPRLEWVDPTFVPPLTVVVQALISSGISGDLWTHTTVSLLRAFSGFALATAIAIPLGFLVGWFKTFSDIFNPFLQSLRQLPTLALFPLFMLLFGIGEVSKLAIITKACIWPIFMNTISGLSHIDPLLIKAARSMKVGPLGLFKKVILPATIPSLFSGMRLSATTSLLILVAAEMMGANAGLGFMIFNAEARFQIPLMYAGILYMTLLGVGLNYGLIGIEKRISRWKEA